MSLSDRPSYRVMNGHDADLVAGTKSARSGADGDRPSGAHAWPGPRELARLRTSLSDRDLAVLHAVEALHFATTRQLLRLHFHDPGKTALATARAAGRCLKRLHQSGLLDRLDRRVGGMRAGSASFVWHLSPTGARLLGDPKRRRSREPSRAHLAHVLDVAELVVRLHEHARTGRAEVLSVETEPACWRPFVGHHGARVLLKPDLRLTLGVEDYELHWFVEVDRGTEHRPALTRKLNAYLAAWRDGGEEARAGVFPRVLWVVPDERRAGVLAGVWRTLSTAPDGMFAAIPSERAIEALVNRDRLPASNGPALTRSHSITNQETNERRST